MIIIQKIMSTKMILFLDIYNDWKFEYELKLNDFDITKTEINKIIESWVSPKIIAFFKFASNVIDW